MLTELPKSENDKPKVLWQYSYTQLRTSADDGKRLLWLDFGTSDKDKVHLKYVNISIRKSEYFLFLFMADLTCH